MTQVLRRLHFEVIQVTNSTLAEMRDAVATFGKQLRHADIGLFYYSGHALQWQKRNYLVPLNAAIATPADLEFEAIDVTRVLDQMETAATRANVLILDTPHLHPFQALDGFQSYTHHGLAPAETIQASLIAYATYPHHFAEGGDGRNSTYTGHLLRLITQLGLSLTELFRQLGEAVISETQVIQEPWVEFTPIPHICLAGCQLTSASAAMTPAVWKTPSEMELAFWVKVERDNTLDGYRTYLKRYPYGRFALLANMQAAMLTNAPLPDIPQLSGQTTTPYSGWVDAEANGAEYRRQNTLKRYPIRAQGRQIGGVDQFRAMFADFLPAPFAYITYYGIATDFYIAKQRELFQLGYTQIWRQAFRNAGGELSYQATWIRWKQRVAAQ